MTTHTDVEARGPESRASTSPSDRLFLTDIADLLGVTYTAAKSYRQRRVAGFPEPAGREMGQLGRTRPWWRRADIEAWIAARPGRGRYDRANAARPRRQGVAQAEHRFGPRAHCRFCGRDIVTTLAGTFRRHRMTPRGSSPTCLMSGEAAS